MTFINLYILFGLGGISIPVIIHLFNRRQAKVIEWGAMKFLLGSLISRKRRVLVEEIILMALRCLLVAALVLAVSRPFSPVQPGISWLILLPLILGVRPNSPDIMMIVSSSRPRVSRSSIRARPWVGRQSVASAFPAKS